MTGHPQYSEIVTRLDKLQSVLQVQLTRIKT